MTTRGANSDNLTMKAETDLGPLVSLLLNSLFASSLCGISKNDYKVNSITYLKISSPNCV